MTCFTSDTENSLCNKRKKSTTSSTLKFPTVIVPRIAYSIVCAVLFWADSSLLLPWAARPWKVEQHNNFDVVMFAGWRKNGLLFFQLCGRRPETCTGFNCIDLCERRTRNTPAHGWETYYRKWHSYMYTSVGSQLWELSAIVHFRNVFYLYFSSLRNDDFSLPEFIWKGPKNVAFRSHQLKVSPNSSTLEPEIEIGSERFDTVD